MKVCKTHSKSGQAPKKITETQNWIQDKFTYLKSHIRRKGLGKNTVFKSPQRGASASAASAHDISCGCTETESMQISIHSDKTHQPSIATPSVVSQPSSVDQQVMDKFTQMTTMSTFFLGPSQETTRLTFCKNMASEVEKLEERDFQKCGS